MPISVVCQKCGKALKVKDEWMGKRATCPGCGSTFIVGAATPPGKTAFNPNAAQQAKQQREAAAGKFSISPSIVLSVIAGVVVIGGIIAFISGPKKVWNQWEALGDNPENDVTSVISYALQCHMSETGEYNPRKGRNTPQANEVMFFRPGFVMSMPDDVDFKGKSTEGEFKGIYHPKTGEVEADVETGGTALPVTGVIVSKGTGKIKVTGRIKNSKVEAEVNGKKAQIIMPPKRDDDE